VDIGNGWGIFTLAVTESHLVLWPTPIFFWCLRLACTNRPLSGGHQVSRFQKGKSGNPAGRPRCRTNPILASIKKEFGSEEQYWHHIAKAAKAGDQNCLNLLAARVRPPFKARSVCVELDIQGDSAKDYTTGVLDAVAKGELPPDEAASFLNAILAGNELVKLEELEQRLNQMERKNGKN
jgi:hypothetical protein